MSRRQVLPGCWEKNRPVRMRDDTTRHMHESVRSKSDERIVRLDASKDVPMYSLKIQLAVACVQSSGGGAAFGRFRGSTQAEGKRSLANLQP